MTIHSFRVGLIELIVSQKNLRNKEYNNWCFHGKIFDLFNISALTGRLFYFFHNKRFYKGNVEVIFENIENECKNGTFHIQ